MIDYLAKGPGVGAFRSAFQADVAEATEGGEKVLLVKPQTFMNLSGAAVAGLKQKHEVADATQVLIISDDLSLPFGKLRIRPKGSAGGQNGLKSIIAKLGTQDFPRIRLGIAPEHPIGNASDFVLGEFPKKDRDTLAEQVAQAADAVEVLLTKGIAEAMSKYN